MLSPLLANIAPVVVDDHFAEATQRDMAPAHPSASSLRAPLPGGLGWP